MFNQLRKAADALFDEIITLTYFMRGSVSYDTMFDATYYERRKFEEFISKRLEIEVKSPSPNY